MMTVRWMTCMVVLFLAFFGGRLLWAHEGHTYVMGTVTAVHDGQLVVQTQGEQTVVIQRDRSTQYHATGVATSSATVRVGDRIVVEMTKEANGLRAADVWYAAVAPRTP